MSEVSGVASSQSGFRRGVCMYQGQLTVSRSLSGSIGKSSVTVPNYEGSYEITPNQEEHIMPTSGRLMHKDMTIHEIPFHEVSNQSGGTTVTIGGY